MKKAISITALFILLALTLRAAADSPSPQTELIGKIIRSSVTFPEEARAQLLEGSVGILFHVDADGKIVVDGISATDPLFAASARRDVEGIPYQFAGVDPAEKFLIRIEFRLQ